MSKPYDIYIRVSQVNGRSGASYQSPTNQEDACRALAKRKGLRVGQVVKEEDVSGGKRVKDRALEGLVKRVEDGKSDGILAFDVKRFARSVAEGSAAIKRIKDAGGEFCDSYGNSTRENSLAINIYLAIGEDELEKLTAGWAKSKGNAIARGVAPFPVPPGYRKRDDGTTAVDADKAKAVLHAFKLRDQNIRHPTQDNSMPAIRRYLAGRGIELSLGGLARMLQNRFYRGELHYDGHEPNLTAHDPIVPADLFERVSRAPKRRGRIGKSDRLLACLGVLRCTCGGRMSVSAKGNRRPTTEYFYRCTAPDCRRRLTISAEIAERVVSDAVRAALEDAEGRASVAHSAQEAAQALARAQGDLDAAISAFMAAGLGTEPAAVERLAELRQTRDEAQERVDQIPAEAVWTVNAARDWDGLSLGGRRELVRATVESAVVARGGRGAERITVQLVGQ
jgi:DNA invertase Pin-like site-specific DNA recombinase